mgnify:CR=1 FL=1
MDGIKILQQRNCKFTGGLRQIPELGDTYGAVFGNMPPDRFFQCIQCHCVEIEGVLHRNKLLLLDKQ